jgi:hypothetical protein
MLSVRRYHGESEWTFGLRFIFVSLWLTFGGFYTPPKGHSHQEEERELSIRAFDGSIWWLLWRNDHEWDPKDWRHNHWNWREKLMTFLFGKRKYIKVEQPPVAAVLTMPEGEYPCTVTLLESAWVRPRLPRGAPVQRAEVTFPESRPVPIPGKGENGWDCGEDAVFSSSTLAASVPEALFKAKQWIEMRRERYGGNGWIPQ